MKALGFIIFGLFVVTTSFAAPSRPSGFRPLFENDDSFSGAEGLAATSEELGDFELILEYSSSDPARTGLYLRGGEEIRIPEAVDAFDDRSASNGWNALKVRLAGSRLWLWLNDEPVVQGEMIFDESGEPLPAQGPVALRSSDPTIRWRNVSVREANAETANRWLREGESEAGYRPIFNENDLSGWLGDLTGKNVSNGVLEWRDGSHIWTDATYDDFILRFEFILSPGANNGLAIRWDGTGDPAYTAMCELQILDNSAERYRDLDPRQYHGSAYGMTAARRGYLRPAGEWNYQEVKVTGSRIRVELNGTEILDTDLSRVDEYMGDKPHPGKSRSEGHIGFAGHGSEHFLQFRRLTLREI